MTLDEAIKHAEEVAYEQDKLCKIYDGASGYTRSHNEKIRTTDAKKCEKCAAEHRQLAEWLKDYKKLLESISEIPTGSTTKNNLAVDCVSRAYLLDDNKYHTVFNDDTGNFEDVVYREDIEKAPPVTTQPKTGHWIHLPHNKAKCSECDDVVLIAQMYGNANYCPNCGADMRGEEDNVCDNVRCVEPKDMYHVYEVYTWDDVSYKKLESFHSKEEAETRCEELKKKSTFKAVTYKVMTDLQYYNLVK